MPQSRQQLLGRISSLLERCGSLSVDLPVDTGYFAVDPELVGQILALLAEVAELLHDIGTYFEAEDARGGAEAIAGGDDASFLREIGASISSALASREVTDLAFMGRNDLLEIRERLQRAVIAENFWKIASTADAGLSRIGRALIPIESAMREYEGLPPMRRRLEDLDDSLEIRRQYGMLWRTVLRAGEPRGEELRGALCKLSRRIALLRHNRIYPFLRIDDRLSVRKLQKRVLAYLDGPGDDSAGRRLWDDLVATFRLLMQVNGRHELCEHDREVVLAAYYELTQRRSSSEPIPHDLLERLDPLLGRDEELDRVLLRPAERPVADWLAPLERLSRELLQDSPTAVSVPLASSSREVSS